jgi:hypothetical protein
MEALAHHTPGPFSWKPHLAASFFFDLNFLLRAVGQHQSSGTVLIPKFLS